LSQVEFGPNRTFSKLRKN